MRNYKKLEIWELAMHVVANTYKVLDTIPNFDQYSLKSQLRRSAVSILSNIAEGCCRSSNKEFNRFLVIALGYSFELETQLLIAVKVKYLEKDSLNELLAQINMFQKKASSYRNKIKSDYS